MGKAADDNIQVCNATTAAQFFHLLRRQMMRSLRRPLIVFTPKSLLRARTSRSTIDELTSGTFEEVLDDAAPLDRAAVRRIVFASGKVAFDWRLFEITGDRKWLVGVEEMGAKYLARDTALAAAMPVRSAPTSPGPTVTAT